MAGGEPVSLQAWDHHGHAPSVSIARSRPLVTGFYVVMPHRTAVGDDRPGHGGKAGDISRLHDCLPHDQRAVSHLHPQLRSGHVLHRGQVWRPLGPLHCRHCEL